MTTQWISALLLALALVAFAPQALADAPPGLTTATATGMVEDIDLQARTLTLESRVYKVPSSLMETLEELDIGDGVDIYYMGDREVTDIQVHEPS